jgi:hypothetical protein
MLPNGRVPAAPATVAKGKWPGVLSQSASFPARGLAGGAKKAAADGDRGARLRQGRLGGGVCGGAGSGAGVEGLGGVRWPAPGQCCRHANRGGAGRERPDGDDELPPVPQGWGRPLVFQLRQERLLRRLHLEMVL